MIVKGVDAPNVVSVALPACTSIVAFACSKERDQEYVPVRLATESGLPTTITLQQFHYIFGFLKKVQEKFNLSPKRSRTEKNGKDRSESSIMEAN